VNATLPCASTIAETTVGALYRKIASLRCRMCPRAHAVLTDDLPRFSFVNESLLIPAPIFFLPLPNQIGAGLSRA